MRERLVRVGHVVDIFPLLDRSAFVAVGGHELIGHSLEDRIAHSVAAGLEDPGEGSSETEKRCDSVSGMGNNVNVELLTPSVRGAYLGRIQSDIANAEHFVLITAFATSEGIALIENAMLRCLNAGGQGTLILALDRQHFNAADVFTRLASLSESFPDKLEVRIVRERAGLLHAKAVFAKLRDGTATLLVGSANLTDRAFAQNHELGLWVNLLGVPEVIRAFQLFAQNIGGSRHDTADLRRLAESLKGHVFPVSDRSKPTQSPPPPELFSDTPAQLSVPIDTFVGDWLHAGYIVGRGRRGLDVLVIRTPGQSAS